MKQTSSVFLISLSPVFNPEEVKLFETMDKQHSSLLYSTLFMNNVEMIEKVKDQYNTVFGISSRDNQYVPKELLSSAVNLAILHNGSSAASFKYLNEKYFSNYSKNLVIFSGSIGLNGMDIQKIFELLSVEDDAVVVGRALNDSISFLGFTKYHEEIFINLDKSYENLLPVICRHNYFVHILEKSMFISNRDDFKLLYAELSKKESLSYCSQKMHEQFTHLFIEYKEQIK